MVIVMKSPRNPSPDLPHIDFSEQLKEAALVLLGQLTDRMTTGKITILALSEYETSPGLRKHLEVSYVETEGTRQ